MASKGLCDSLISFYALDSALHLNSIKRLRSFCWAAFTLLTSPSLTYDKKAQW
jgi:hypothetical protein